MYRSIFIYLYDRLFLGELQSELWKSSIHSRLEVDNRLEKFKDLKEKTLNWSVKREGDSSEGCAVQEVTIAPPPRKKLKKHQKS